MTDNETPEHGDAKPEYQRTAMPGPGSPEYEAMDQLAKMFERQVDELQGKDPDEKSGHHH